MDYTIKHNENDFRFETEVDGYLAYVEYTPLDKELDLIHTWVPKEIGGKGIAAALVKFAMDYAMENHFKVVPTCPYVKAFLIRHEEYKDCLYDK